ncbi:hypothetical protein PNOK_0655500 [Pyrrhoderma noxium]|uniref:Uncharacterized protein n=1 Tax=Pyrrhoderma noxium TaxID=2282107 RepID=A0A286UEX7_9AGAM|nr:hypothetical protein PNOK_0655500 [Pyrrhoderma noxium]
MFYLVLYLPPSFFKSCSILTLLFQMLVGINIFIAAIILTRRLCSIYEGRKVVVITAWGVIGVKTFVILVLFAIAYNKNKGRSSKDLTSVIECIGVEALNWIPLIMFVAEEIGCLFLLALKRFLTIHMEGSPYPYSALFRALVDDGLLYYTYSITIALADIFLLFFPKQRAIALGLVGLDAILHSIMSMHLCIHLRYVNEATLYVESRITATRHDA